MALHVTGARGAKMPRLKISDIDIQRWKLICCSLAEKVGRHAYRVTDEDIAAAMAPGLNEDEVFEIVVSAAVGQATRQYDTALIDK